MTAATMIAGLRDNGFRITNARKAIIAFFFREAKPVSVPDILSALAHMGVTANKTTIYREITFLLGRNLILEIELGERKKRYELVMQKHHHHLVCVKCSDIRDVELKSDLRNEEKRIAQETDFLVQNHALEFFGLCGRCR